MVITNISNPKDSQFEDSSNRVLKMKLTDGVTSCYAIEFIPIPSLSATLKPGTKLSVANVRVENGLLLLNPSNTMVLGGHVSSSVCYKQEMLHSSYDEFKVSTIPIPPKGCCSRKTRQGENPIYHTFVKQCITRK